MDNSLRCCSSRIRAPLPSIHRTEPEQHGCHSDEVHNRRMHLVKVKWRFRVKSAASYHGPIKSSERTMVHAPTQGKKWSSPWTSPNWYFVGRVGRNKATTLLLGSRSCPRDCGNAMWPKKGRRNSPEFLESFHQAPSSTVNRLGRYTSGHPLDQSVCFKATEQSIS